LDVPIPLGGTSNHFKLDKLIELGGWDPFNVTEDADLGVRVFEKKYKVGVVNSTTLEEANNEPFNWIRQRSRWIKGYMQTTLVHMRNPVR
ncbi:glycosyltransferase family 2 protein, partial [Acinetobacter baumannii]